MTEPVADCRISTHLNGLVCEAEVPAHRLLIDWLRDSRGLTGCHRGCDSGQCGACTVHLDGKPVKSCLMLAVQADGATLTTIEGLAGPAPSGLHAVQAAFRDHHALQCGYCTTGMIMAIAGWLESLTEKPDDAAIRTALKGNLCRCTGYHNIVAAVSDLVEQRFAEAAA